MSSLFVRVNVEKVAAQLGHSFVCGRLARNAFQPVRVFGSVSRMNGSGGASRYQPYNNLKAGLRVVDTLNLNALTRVQHDYYQPTDALMQQASKCLPSAGDQRAAFPLARQLIGVAQQPAWFPSMEKILHELPLSRQQGRALMALAECLIRIPDAETRIAMIVDQIGSIDWASSMSLDKPLWYNALMLSVETAKNVLAQTQKRTDVTLAPAVL